MADHDSNPSFWQVAPTKILWSEEQLISVGIKVPSDVASMVLAVVAETVAATVLAVVPASVALGEGAAVSGEKVVSIMGSSPCP
jgi:hypothetical protein